MFHYRGHTDLLSSREVKMYDSAVLTEIVSQLKPCDFVACAISNFESTLDNPSLGSLTQFLNIQPLDSFKWNDVLALRQAQALFSKRDSFYGLSVDRKSAALDSFLAAETSCRGINAMLDRPGQSGAASLLLRMQRKIGDLLGPVPDMTEFNFGFGPGTNIGLGRNTSVRFKLSENVTTTVGAARRFAPVAHHYPHWEGLLKPIPVMGNKWTTVPKSYKTDRGICVEPILNSFLQKGVGSFLRDRLKRVGIDLTNQTVNQWCALEGSRDGLLATIDLSMASDTLSRNLVREVLPFDWWDFLDDIRSPYTQMPDGRWLLNEKFSSMGNGFTFELETLVFWALVTSVSDGIFSIYGDDIIVESIYYEDVITALSQCGFTPNKDKSFSTGKFRESCGKDYWDGSEVRPCYVKSDWSTHEIFRYYNWCIRSGVLDPSFLLSLSAFPKIYGPDGFGDGHLVDPDFRRSFDKRGWLGYEFKTMVAQPRLVKTPCRSDFGAFLYVAGTSSNVSIPDVVLPCWEPRQPFGYSERSFAPRYKKTKLRVYC